MNTLETTDFTTIETSIKEVSSKILDLSRELCLQLTLQGRRTSPAKFRRQRKKQRKLATKILKEHRHLSKLHRQARIIRRQYRRQPVPANITGPGLQIKKEQEEFSTTSYYRTTPYTYNYNHGHSSSSATSTQPQV